MDFPFTRISNRFSNDYVCFSAKAALSRRTELDERDRILLPPSALDELTLLNAEFPMYFNLRANGFSTHCGVIEFTAPEGVCYVPSWIMQNNLGGLGEGEHVLVEKATLPVATFVRFQPITSDFLNIFDHKAVLENTLRELSCLTEDDFIILKYIGKEHHLKILKCEPAAAVSIIDCDMSVDFAEPFIKDSMINETQIGQVAEGELKDSDDDGDIEDTIDHTAFQGVGFRLGRPGQNYSHLERVEPVKENVKAAQPKGIPDYEYRIGKIQFVRNRKIPKKSKESKNEKGPFTGTGRAVQ